MVPRSKDGGGDGGGGGGNDDKPAANDQPRPDQRDLCFE